MKGFYMTTRTKLPAEERAERFRKALPQIIQARKRKEKTMRFFNISQQEETDLEHMNVRALADAPEGSHAYFDTDGVYIMLNDVLIETKDFVVTKTTPAEEDYSWINEYFECDELKP
jgi:hypothetical protein